MNGDKPIHLCVRLKGRKDIKEAMSHCEKTNDYVSWSYQSEVNVLSDIDKLNKNIAHFNNNFVYFTAEQGKYVRKAKLLSVEGRGTKDGDKHLPDGWGGEAALWINCIEFENSNSDDLKYLLLYSDNKPYLATGKSIPRSRNRNVNLVVFDDSRIEPPKINNPPEDSVSEVQMNNKEQILISTINESIKNAGFTVSLPQITNYYLSLKTKPFVILTGISGTGKTKITELFAQAVCKDFDKQYLLLPVRPDWNDDRNLIGYYNPLTKQYQTTPFLDFIMKAAEDAENPYFVCLDEMNIARVEYYFSTFLSAMESGSKEISLPGYNGDKDYKKSIPSNLFFTGTVNMDETTYRFSPKVLDRANTIEFNEIDLLKSREIENPSTKNPELTELFKKYFLNDEVRQNGNSPEAYKEWETKNWYELVGLLDRINKEALEKQNLHFGYRIRDEVMRYLYFTEILDNEDFTTQTALDFQIKQKILPRIKGPGSIKEALNSLKEIIQEYPRSTAKLDQMIGALDNGYTDFYQ